MIERIRFQVGSTEPRLLPADRRSWFKVPGAYVERRRAQGRDELVYYIVPPLNASPRRCSRGEAEAQAWAEFRDKETPVAQVAHDWALVAQQRQTAKAQEDGAGPVGLSATYPAALDCLKAHGAEFDVVAEIVNRADGTRTDGWRHVVRKDTNVVLHIATDAYEVIPQREPLSLLDPEATVGNIVYRRAWASREMTRIRPIGDERGRNVEVAGRRVGIIFDIPTVKVRAFAGHVAAGGTLLTSHDGSTAIRATACLNFRGVTIFHVRTQIWKHSAMALDRARGGKAALTYLTRAALALVRDAEACVGVGGAEAADVVLRAIHPDLYVADPVAGTMDEGERQSLINLRNDARARALERLTLRAAELGSRHADVGLGGFAYVLAAPYALSDRASEASFYDGDARKRMSAALTALARHAGVATAGMVPNAATPVPTEDEAGAEGGAA